MYGAVIDGRSSVSSPEDGRYKLTGKEHDAPIGLDYFGARYYDSWNGRWGQVDLIYWDFLCKIYWSNQETHITTR
ncbi:MAG: RHS repeat-associated core domain-containing protein [Ignavibacteriaceae bacterium]|nr:RHS repeat-associated core domain-containing protein [Ignavibacteriaceae bacterium]